MLADGVKLVRGEVETALDVVIQVNLNTAMSGPREEEVVTERRGAQSLLLQLHLLAEVCETTERLNLALPCNLELLRPLPDIFLIKTKGIVSDEKVGVPLFHEARPVKNHLLLCRLAMDNGARHIIAGATYEDVLLGG